MFELLRKDIKIGDSIKLYLTTGKEPEGRVVEIGDNFVILQSHNASINRFFDKLIGGWDIIRPTTIELGPAKAIDKGEKKEHIFEIDQLYILEKTKELIATLDQEILNKYILSNASLIGVSGTSFVATNNEGVDFIIPREKVVGEKLHSLLKTFHNGSNIPVVLNATIRYTRKFVNAVVLSSSLNQYLEYFIYLIGHKRYRDASVLLNIINDVLKPNIYIGNIINEFKKLNISQKLSTIDSNELTITDLPGENRAFKNVEKEINDLIRTSKFEFALSQIEKELATKSIDDKYKSTLLLKKAQIYSSINDPQASEIAYQELVNLNVKIKAPAKNLSHLYTELSRLQSIKTEKQPQAIESVKEALKYNPNNNYAISLLKQLEGKANKSTSDDLTSKINEEHLLIEADDESTAISKMIDIDIREHKYSHAEIIKNGVRPTSFIAKLILSEAKKAKHGELSERYPIYLEAAKAFSELNVGSYDLRDYLESVAYYSMLKGNSLFISFRNQIFNSEFDIVRLKRLRDSACSYYIESLNLLSNIEPKLLLSILANYLKLSVATYYIDNKENVDFKVIFKGLFADIFTSCLRNKNKEIEKIAYSTILFVGSSSVVAWNNLARLPGGTGTLYGFLDQNKRKIEIFNLINEIENTEIKLTLTPGEFFKTTFQQRKKKEFEFIKKITAFSNIEIEPHNLDFLITEWKKLIGFEKLLTYTDNETRLEIDNILLILQPYLNRGQSERTNILIQARNIIERQIKFINENTTFYGRTFFYGLLNNWKINVDNLLEEKIAQSYPTLSLRIDPPYYIQTNEQISAPVIIKNEGEATTEGFVLRVIYESTIYENKVELYYESTDEIAAGGMKEMNLEIPVAILEESNAVEIKVEISAIYQKKKLPLKIYEFTVEKEPESYLNSEDIPWQTGHSTPEKLFFGRGSLIEKLTNHYKSRNRDKPYMLYGLTRTGKSSILEYLRKRLESESIFANGKNLNFIAFEWQLQEISNNINARDFYEDILIQRTYHVLKKVLEKNNNWDSDFRIDEKGKFSDFKRILEFLKSKNYYPIFFIDEFSFIKDLMDRGTIGKAFLAALREYSLTNLASFVFAGTYDVKKLITDERYGITGQLVHIIEYQVDNIDEDDAESLISIIDNKLSFTPEAIDYIKKLTGNIPYFIQIVCKNCGDYAVENKRRHIGYPELEKVVKILTGEINSDDSILVRLPSGTFQNNQYSPTDPKEVNVLISSLCYFNRGSLNPRGVASHELEKFWSDKGLPTFKSKLAISIQSLLERKILSESLDEEIPVYNFSVNLFRRWWYVSHQDISLEIATLKDE